MLLVPRLILIPFSPMWWTTMNKKKVTSITKKKDEITDTNGFIKGLDYELKHILLMYLN